METLGSALKERIMKNKKFLYITIVAIFATFIVSLINAPVNQAKRELKRQIKSCELVMDELEQISLPKNRDRLDLLLSKSDSSYNKVVTARRNYALLVNNVDKLHRFNWDINSLEQSHRFLNMGITLEKIHISLDELITKRDVISKKIQTTISEME